MAEINELIGLIEDRNLRLKVKNLVLEPLIEGNYTKLSFEECPAGVYQHHSYNGGLIQHTVAVTRIALTLCELLEEVYGGEVNRDLVISGSLLHDVMKCYSYMHDGEGGYRNSQLGEKVDHLSLLVAELYKRGFPLEVIHVAASHHGDVSPVKPKTVEALIVSIADLTDSELSRRMLRAAEYLLRQTLGERHRLSSSEEALEVVQTKVRDGWEGLRRLMDDKP